MSLTGFLASGLRVVRKSNPIKLKNRIHEAYIIPLMPLPSGMNGIKLLVSKIAKPAIIMTTRRTSFMIVTRLLK